MTTVVVQKVKDGIQVVSDSLVIWNYKELWRYAKYYTYNCPIPITFASAWNVADIQFMEAFLKYDFNPINNKWEQKMLKDVTDVLFLIGRYIDYVNKYFKWWYTETDNLFIFIQWDNIFLYEWWCVTIIDSHISIWSWHAYALWYMESDPDAVKAVKAACKYDIGSHEPVNVLLLKKDNKPLQKKKK